MKDALVKITAKGTRRVIGLMSGTSADGVDAALLEISGDGPQTQWDILAFRTTPFEAQDRTEILSLQDSGTPHLLERLSRLHFRLGDLYAAACAAVVDEAGYRLDEVDLVGLHGQTVFHGTGSGASAAAPMPGTPTPGTCTPTPATLQIGEAQVLAERTGISVVHNFRARDVAAGGTGAPLVPLVDLLLFRSADVARLSINIGGIANFTAFPANPLPDQVIAFDTGPGNMLIDALAERYSGGKERFDRDGHRAAAAPPDKGLLDDLMADDYILKRPPKSAGREEFGAAFVEAFMKKASERKLSPAAALSTATSFTVRSLVEAYRLYVAPVVPVQEVLVAGGGVHNRTLMERLAVEMAPLPVRSTAYHGLDPDAKEAVAFAILANESVFGRPGNLPAVTGARHRAVLGSFVPGKG